MKLNELFDIKGEKLSLNDIKDIKELSNKLGISEDELKKYSDKELLDIFKNIGLHDFIDIKKFNKKEIEQGIKVEREHTNSNLVALLIVKDHLSELPDYYKRLEKMENKK